MALSDVIAAKQAEGEDLSAAKAAVESACAVGGDVVEVEVPYGLADELRAWVEGQGARCGVVKGFERKTLLVINLKLAPRPEPVPEPASEPVVEG